MKTNRSPHGFATVLALLIVALLVVVLVSAAMILRVETFTSSNAQKIAEARQNALYGMETALADLQELAGPDQRVTATAELNRNAADPLWVPEFLPGGNATNSPTTPSRNWTGVWDVSKNRYLPDAGTPGRVVSNVGAGTNQVSPQPLKWLVSGGMRKGGGTESQTNNVTPLNYPGRVGADGSISGTASLTDHVVLLGNGSVDLPANPNDGIVVPKVPIYNPTSPQPSNPVGAYAFWVGDEGVKSKFQDGAETKAFADTYSGSSRDLYRLMAPQKLGIGAMTGNGTTTLKTDGYDPSASGFLSALRRISSDPQVAYLPGGDKLGPDFKRRFHDLTLYSQGVLSDVKKGGLKQDLTVYLQQGDIAGKIQDTDLLYEDQRDAGSDASDPRSPFRTRFPGFHPSSNNGLPRIGLLRSWYNLTTPTVRPQTATQHGMFPVITRCEWPIWLQMNFTMPKNDPGNYPFTLPANAVEMRIHPVITLYNPYNVALPGQTYSITIPIGTGVTFEIRSTPAKNTSGDPTVFNITSALGGADKMEFEIPEDESELAPGQSKIFTLSASGGAYSAPMQMVSEYYTGTPGFGTGTTTATYPVDPDGTNPNGYFVVPRVLPVPANPLKITEPRKPTNINYLLSRPDPAPPAPIYTLVTLATGGSTLSEVSDFPEESKWVPTNTSSHVDISFSGWNAGDSVSKGIDTRKPTKNFQVRPLTHIASIKSNFDPVGGSLAQLLGLNIRSAKNALPPGIWVGTPLRWWGSIKNYPDGNTEIKICGYSPPLFYGVSPSLEIFPYTSSSGTLEVSSDFSPSDLGLSSPLFSTRNATLENVSIADFQHVNLAGHSWQPSYVVGNSYVDSKLKGRDCYAGFFRYGDAGAGIEYFTRTGVGNPANSSADSENRIYDASYMANDAVWDRFFLSGAATSTSQSADLLENKASLPNSRLLFRKTAGENYNVLSSASDKLDRGAAYLLNDGAFNVNSTSVEAWKALLSSHLGLKVNSSTAGADETVFTRMPSPGGGSGTFFDPPSTQPAAEKAGAYTGARRLNDEEIQVLAEEVVKQVRQRGPFTSVSDFVNRRLTSELSGPPFTETDVSKTGLMGTLQAAIDSASDRFLELGRDGINSSFYKSGVRGTFYTPEKIQVFPGGDVGQITNVNVSDSDLRGAVVPRLAMLGRPWYYSAAGVPGFLTQADILQAVGPLLTARSDTFRIRSYGEVKNPKNGKIEARAWCEAIVQRVPDPLKDSPTDDDIIWPERPSAVSNPANAAGRKFKIVAFRWLTPEEV